MDKIKRFIECELPLTQCNLKCEYCYVIQRDIRNKAKLNLKYSPEIIGKSFRQERWGGICYISICAYGETMIADETREIAFELLRNGHYVNITTNGTLSEKFDKFLKFPKDYLDRLHFSFSFHYLELKRLNLIDTFFENIKKVRNAGCSFVCQLNLYDGYVNHLDEIKEVCMKNIGAWPQLAATRKENNISNDIEFMTSLPLEEYVKLGESFDSPLFRYTIKNFNKRRTEFCYAGDWSFQLNLGTGVLRRCYASGVKQNIFENPDKPINFVAIGKHCNSLFCMNSSHYMSLGVIPEVKGESYAQLRNRPEANWYSDTMQNFLNGKLYNNNPIYSYRQKMKTEIYSWYELARNIAAKLIFKR